jgi:hypothetical protein
MREEGYDGKEEKEEKRIRRREGRITPIHPALRMLRLNSSPVQACWLMVWGGGERGWRGRGDDP